MCRGFVTLTLVKTFHYVVDRFILCLFHSHERRENRG